MPQKLFLIYSEQKKQEREENFPLSSWEEKEKKRIDSQNEVKISANMPPFLFLRGLKGREAVNTRFSSRLLYLLSCNPLIRPLF